MANRENTTAVRTTTRAKASGLKISENIERSRDVNEWMNGRMHERNAGETTATNDSKLHNTELYVENGKSFRIRWYPCV